VGAVIGATFWPTALLVAVEILTRVDWPDLPRWVALRYGGLVPVTGVAAFVSYRHMAALLTARRRLADRIRARWVRVQLWWALHRSARDVCRRCGCTSERPCAGDCWEISGGVCERCAGWT
jgi:hypothetical protein